MLGGLGLGLAIGNNAIAPPVVVGGGGGGTPFSSLGISTFDWWTADQPATINSGSSNFWAGAKNGTFLTQATGANRPTLSGSGTTSKLSFDTTDELNLAGAPAAYDAVAVIITNSSNTNYRTLFWNFAGQNSCLLEATTNRLGAYNGGFADSTLTIAPSTAAIVHMRTDGSGFISMSVNGGTIIGAITNYSSNRAIAEVGNTSGGGQPIGDMQALAISGSGVWSSGDLDKAIGCLAWEWGLQGLLPIGHAYKSVAP